MPSWLSCLPFQLPFLGPTYAFQGQVKPTQIFGAWHGVVLLSTGVDKPQSTPFPIVFLQRSRNLPPWLQLAHRQREGPSWSLLPGPSCLGEGWVGGHSLLLALWAIWEGAVWEDLSCAYLNKQNCTGPIFPIFLQRHAGKGVFYFYCSHIDVPTNGTSQHQKGWRPFY